LLKKKLPCVRHYTKYASEDL